MMNTSIDTPPRRRGASPETIPLPPSFVSSRAQQAAAAAASDDDDRDSTTPSKRKQLPHNLLGTRAVAATAITCCHRHWSFKLYFAPIIVCGVIALMNMKGSASLVRQSAEAIRSSEDLLVLPTTIDTRISSTTTPHSEQQQQQERRRHVPQQKNSTLALLYPPGLMGGYRNQVIRFISLCVHAAEKNLTQLLLPSLLWSTQVQIHVKDPDGSPDKRSRKGSSGWNTTTIVDSNSITKAVLGPWQPIPMEWIFDVDYWNEYAAGNTINVNKNDVDSQEGRLPSLVLLRDLNGSDCWEKFPDFVRDDNHSTTNMNINEQLSPLQRAVWQQGTLGPLSNLTQQLVASQLPKFNPRKQDFLPAVQHCQNPVVYDGGRKFGRLWIDYMGYRNKK
jgi:hypothetical protein